jgi:hypothetical protein
VKAAPTSERTVAKLRRARVKLEPRAIRAVSAELSKQCSAVVKALYDNYGKTRIVHGRKIASEDIYDADKSTRELREVIDPLYLAILDENSRIISPYLEGDLFLDDPATREYLRDAGTKIADISIWTRKALQDALVEGQFLGESVDELAARIKSMPAFDRPRAKVIARTELGHASNTAALALYKQTGTVQGIKVFDGDSDEECASANGTILTLQEAESYPTLAHPNCVRAFGAVIDLPGDTTPEPPTSLFDQEDA